MFEHHRTFDKVVTTEVLITNSDKEALGLPSQSWRRYAFLLSEVSQCEEIFGDDESFEYEGSFTCIRMKAGDEHIINLDFSQFLKLWTT